MPDNPENQHLVPQFLLKRWADRRGQVSVFDRVSGETYYDTVKHIASECGYYDFKSQTVVNMDVATLAQARRDHPMLEQLIREHDGKTYVDSRAVETVLGRVESIAATVIRTVLKGRFPPTEHDREALSMFISLQHVRGHYYREEMAALNRALMSLRANEFVNSPEGKKYTRDYIRKLGQAATPDAVERVAQAVRHNPPEFELNPDWLQASMLELALEALTPMVFGKTWRLLVFRTPDVVISDEPVGLWARPDRDLNEDTLAIGTADAVYFPLSPTRCLQLLSPGDPEATRWTIPRPSLD